LKRLVSLSINNPKLNLHLKECLFSGANRIARTFLCGRVCQSLSLSFFEIDFAIFVNPDILHPHLAKVFHSNSHLFLQNAILFENSILFQTCEIIDNSVQNFLVFLSSSPEVSDHKLFTAKWIVSVIILFLSNENFIEISPNQVNEDETIQSLIRSTQIITS
jgi:hypothetical protein